MMNGPNVDKFGDIRVVFLKDSRRTKRTKLEFNGVFHDGGIKVEAVKGCRNSCWRVEDWVTEVNWSAALPRGHPFAQLEAWWKPPAPLRQPEERE